MKTPEDAIGRTEGDDYILAPDKHAAALPPEAGPLARVLRRSAIQVVVDRYVRADEEAIAAQKTYKDRARAAIYASGAAVLAGALLLFFAAEAPAESWVRPFGDFLRYPLLIVQIAAVGLTAYLTYYLRETDPLATWMNRRAEAEMARVALFNGVCGVSGKVEEPQADATELPLLPLQLEYFRRYQLEVQLNYYHHRGRQHEAASKRLVTTGGVLAAVSAAAAAGVGLAGEIGLASAVALVLLAAPVAIAAHGSIKLLDQDRLNALRYANTHEKLSAWRAGLDEVRAAAAKGDAEAVAEFVKGVNGEISLEHREWLTRRQEAEKPTLDLSKREGG